MTLQSVASTKVTRSMVSVFIKLSDPLDVTLQMLVEMLAGPDMPSNGSDDESVSSPSSDSAPDDAGLKSSTPPA